VRAVHLAYVEAGAGLVTTNTFMGSRLALELHGAGAQVRALNEAGARLARETAGARAFVLGDVGPFGGFLEPVGDATADAVRASFREQAEALLAGGADAALVETMSDPAEAALAVEACRAAGFELVFATFAFLQRDGGFRTMTGSTVEEAVAAALAAGADAVGANCGTELSLALYEELVRELVAAAGGAPIIAQPNAGTPEVVDGHAVYRLSPEAFAAGLRRLVAAGARVVGGCCGTTPAHIAAAARELRPD
jgi:5-methyltetrahydrofolate--homocysteine methyltransferase